MASCAAMRRLEAGVSFARRHQYVGAALVIGCMVAIFFSPIVRYGATFSTVENFQRSLYPWYDPADRDPPPLAVQGDQAVFIYPRQVFLHRSLTEDGRVPLWNPLSFAGHPFLADTSTGFAYPPRLALNWLLEPSWAHDLYVMAHLFAAGMAMFALLKEFGSGFAGALLAGVAWSFSSYGVAWMMLELVGPMLALLPLALLLIHRWHRRRSLRDLLAAGGVLGVLFLGASAEISLLSFLTSAGYAAALSGRDLVSHWSEMSRRQRAGQALAPVFLVGVAVAVAAVALLPFVGFRAASSRTHSDYATLQRAGPVHLRTFVRVLAPPDTPLDVASLATEQLFVGTLTGVLAVVGFALRRPGAGLGRGLVVVTALYLLRTPVTWVGYHLVPGLKGLDGFWRASFVFDLGVALLGGLGLNALLAGTVSLLARARSDRPSPSGALARALVPGLLAAVCVVATGWQLLSYGRGANPPFQERDAAHLFPSTPVIDQARAALGPGPGRGRLLAMTIRGLPPALPLATGMALDLPMADGYEPLMSRHSTALWRVVQGESHASARSRIPYTFGTAFTPSGLRTDLLPRLGVQQVLAPPELATDPGWQGRALAGRGLRPTYSGPDGILYEVDGALPRAFTVTAAEWVRSDDEALRRFADPSFDARASVLISGEPPVGGADASTAPVEASSGVEWRSDQPDRLRMTVRASQPSWLVLLDTWEPGWKATVNGRERPVRRADFSFRAVQVPAGTSDVSLSYRPIELAAGAGVSLVAMTAVALALSWPFLRRRAGRGGRTTTSAPSPSRPPGGHRDDGS